MAPKTAPKKAQPTKTPKATKPAAPKNAAGVAVPARPRGKPSPYAGRMDEIKESVCKQLAQGVTMADICRQDGMPERQAIREWAEADEQFRLNIARARDDGADVIAEQSLEIVDQPPERGPDGKIDPASVAHQKLRAEHRLKLLAKWNPKKYGEKLDTTVSGPNGGPAQFSLTVGYMHAQRREDDDEA